MPLQLTRIVSVMLGVHDLEASTRFYTETLGLKATLQSPFIVLLDAGSVILGLSPGLARMAAQPAGQKSEDQKIEDQKINGATEVSFAVDNIRSAHADLQNLGVTFLNDPRQVTDKEFAVHFRDPDGHLLSIFGPEA
jgi:catechol 2,3-dioxygenase-like lactoylglutathione lyase family enzyme